MSTFEPRVKLQGMQGHRMQHRSFYEFNTLSIRGGKCIFLSLHVNDYNHRYKNSYKNYMHLPLDMRDI